MQQPLNFPALGCLLQALEADVATAMALPIAVPGLLSLNTADELRDLAPAVGLPRLVLRRTNWELQANGLLMRLEKLTGHQGLMPDVHVPGAGLIGDDPFARAAQLQQPHPETGLSPAICLIVALGGQAHGDAWLVAAGEESGISVPADARRFLIADYYGTGQ